LALSAIFDDSAFTKVGINHQRMENRSWNFACALDWYWGVHEMMTWETFAKLVDLTRNDPYSCNFSIPGDL